MPKAFTSGSYCLVNTFPSLPVKPSFVFHFFRNLQKRALKAQSAGVIRSAAPPKEKEEKVEEVSIITSLNFSAVAG